MNRSNFLQSDLISWGLAILTAVVLAVVLVNLAMVGDERGATLAQGAAAPTTRAVEAGAGPVSNGQTTTGGLVNGGATGPAPAPHAQ